MFRVATKTQNVAGYELLDEDTEHKMLLYFDGAVRSLFGLFRAIMIRGDTSPNQQTLKKAGAVKRLPFILNYGLITLFLRYLKFCSSVFGTASRIIFAVFKLVRRNRDTFSITFGCHSVLRYILTYQIINARFRPSF